MGVGVLGGFTTFSTYAVQSHDLVTSGHPLVALVYLVGTVLSALLAVVAGVLLVRRVATAWQGPGGRTLT
ncbi:MAG TPA: CrcB family protein [Dermatophilaceae bacterium]